MPTKLPAEISAFMEKYGVRQDEIWQVHGASWVVKHKALERVAQASGIVFDAPTVLEGSTADKTVVLLAYARLGERSEWSIGEASPVNNKNGYPWAIAEKRLKDRLILKLLQAHGDLYSEEEADDFKEKPKQERKPLTGPLNRSQLVEKLREIDKDLMACSDIDEFDSCLRSYSEVTEQAARDIPEAWLGPVEDGTAWKDAFEAIRQKLLDKSGTVGPFPILPSNPTGREQAEWCKAITERMGKCRDSDELEALEKIAEPTRLRCTAEHKGRPYGDILKERFQRRNLELAGNTAAA